MDDSQLKRLLSEAEAALPAPDEIARDAGIAGAVVEFERVQQDASKRSQGFRLPGRLMDSFNATIRRRMMKKPVMAGWLGAAFGLGAVFPVVLAVVFWTLSDDEYEIVRRSMPASPVSQVAEAPPAETDATSGDTAVAVSPASERSPVMMRREMRRDTDSLRAPLRAASERTPDYSAMEPGVSSPREWRDRFEHAGQNPVRVTRQEPVSTFSVDVDTASYSFVRRMINDGALPPKDAVRVEEMVNYFDYVHLLPTDSGQPFRPTLWVHSSPWNESRKLIYIGIGGYDMAPADTPAANLVFLLDVSGSMDEPDKLPLVKNSLKLLLENLKPDDSVAIVVYAGAAGAVLEPTPVRDKATILRALENLEAGGSTAGAEGIRLAYQLAESRFDENAVNRIILATDGDFNVGMTGIEELKGLIERKRKSGIFLSVLGFGRGNLNDHLMQQLAQNGNGVAAYIDTLQEASKVLVEEASSALFPIAKDVKIQVEFNPARVAEYRLIGYETRALRREDFNNDAVDAGDIGAGHSVTALYEITPTGSGTRLIEDRRYQTQAGSDAPGGEFENEYAFLKIRYKLPNEDTSRLITAAITTADEPPPAATMEDVLCPPGGIVSREWKCIHRNANWAAAVAGFAQLLKGGRHTGDFDYDDVIRLAEQHKGPDRFGYRAEFLRLVRLAKSAAAIEAQ